MIKRLELLRLDYLFSVLIPVLLAIYLNNLNPFSHFDIIIGFVFLGITGNVWNDYYDMKNPKDKITQDRVKGYHPRELFSIGLGSFFLGITLLIRTCLHNFINLILLGSIVFLVFIYCFVLKSIPIINNLVLVFSHVILPYLIIKIDAAIFLFRIDELMMLVAFVLFSVTAQFVHEVIDNEALINRFSLKTCQRIIWIFSIGTLSSAILGIILLQDFYLAPILFMPLGIMFTFRKAKKPTRGVKDVGIILGNLFLLYFFGLIVLQLNLII
ncbi:MAG: UbiA family prenyltransferase [Candidatus Lokiarchaeota archaeon]